MIHHFYEWLVRPYHSYETYMIYLEVIAASIGVASVVCAYRRSVFVYIFGFISAFIYVYLLYSWELFGDMILNCYFLGANLVGLLAWLRHLEKDSKTTVYIQRASSDKKKKAVCIFVAALIVTPFIYTFQKQVSIFNLPGYSYIDCFLTGTCFTALYFQINRCINAWYLWITADAIYIPLFIYKGAGITAIQYSIFLTLVCFTLREWRIKLAEQEKTL